MKIDVNRMVKMGVLSALATVLMLVVRFPIIPAANFLEYEPADAVMLLAAFMYGPLAGLVVTFVVSFIQAVTVSAGSGWVGFVMHVIASGTLVVVAGTIYKHFRTLAGAAVGLAAGSLCMTAVMVPANLFFTVRFYGIPHEVVKGLLWTGIIPFNIIKSLTNSIIVLLVYKPLSVFLKGHLNVSRRG